MSASVTAVPAVCAITALGRAAHANVERHARGRVLAVFRRSFYVVFDRDIICIGSAEIGLGPLNVLCARRFETPWTERGIAIGADVACSATTLDICGRLRFVLDTASVWQSSPAPALDPRVLDASMKRLSLAVQRRAPGGLGALCRAAISGGAIAATENDDLLLRTAIPVVRVLRGWLRRALTGHPDPPSPVDALIGLGSGLTPSGDDFLGGVMIALHYAGRGDVARRLAEVVLPSAERDTSLLSAAYLRCAAAGEGSKVLFDALESLFAGDALLAQRLDDVDAVGHTSGWDCLAGAATACGVIATLEEPPTPVPPRAHWTARR